MTTPLNFSPQKKRIALMINTLNMSAAEVANMRLECLKVAIAHTPCGDNGLRNIDCVLTNAKIVEEYLLSDTE